MILEIPDEFVRALETKVPADQVEGILRRSLAKWLYLGGDLPLEKSIQLARMGESEFAELVKAR